MLKQTLLFTNPFRLSMKNAQLVIASKEISGIINIWGEIEQKVLKKNCSVRIFLINLHWI
jgi:hypothetical protein